MKCFMCQSECKPYPVRIRSKDNKDHIWVCKNKCKTADNKFVWNGWADAPPNDPNLPKLNPACSTYVTDLFRPDYPKSEVPEEYHEWLFRT